LLIHKFWHKGCRINVVKKKVAEKLRLSPSTIRNAWDGYRDFYLRLQVEGRAVQF
jgi:hypothetical protein